MLRGYVPERPGLIRYMHFILRRSMNVSLCLFWVFRRDRSRCSILYDIHINMRDGKNWRNIVWEKSERMYCMLKRMKRLTHYQRYWDKTSTSSMNGTVSI